MKRLLTIAAICTAMASAPATLCAQENPSQNTVSQSATDTAHSEWLHEFTKVKVSANITIRFVRIAESEAPRIVYDTKGETETKFKASVDKSGQLNISEKITRDAPVRTDVVVYYHSLESVSIANASVTFDQPIEAHMTEIHVSDGTIMSAEIKTASLDASLSGRNTRLTLSGNARYLELKASSGRVDAAELEVMSAEVTASYSAVVTLNVNDRIVASATTSASVKYAGTPDIVVKNTVLGGEVRELAK